MKNGYGFTILEIVMVCTMILILTGLAMPLIKHKVVREKELELKHALREIRSAIDVYKDDVDNNRIEPDGVNNSCYPSSLDVLIDGKRLLGSEKKKYFLRRIPVDPITNQVSWGLKTIVDVDNLRDQQYGIKSICDVHSLSHKLGTNNIPYDQW